MKIPQLSTAEVDYFDVNEVNLAPTITNSSKGPPFLELTAPWSWAPKRDAST